VASVTRRTLALAPHSRRTTAAQAAAVEQLLPLLLLLLLRHPQVLVLQGHSATAHRSGTLSQQLAASLFAPRRVTLTALALHRELQHPLLRLSLADCSVAHMLLLLLLLVVLLEVLLARHLQLERSLLLLLATQLLPAVLSLLLLLLLVQLLVVCAGQLS
jgi:hypothetical protein